MNIFLVIVGIIMIVISLSVIIAICMQEGTNGGLGALTGDAEQRIGRNFGKTIDAKLGKYTKVGMVIMFILSTVVTVISINAK